MLRVGAAAILLGPMAISDWRGRSLNTETLYVSLGMGACFLLHDVLTGAFFGHLLLTYLNMALTIIMCSVLLIMRKRITAGSADAFFIAAIAMIIPPIGGIHIAWIVVLVGFVMGFALLVLHSLVRNIRDIVCHRRFSNDLFLTHVKRKGEKFTIAKHYILHEKAVGKVTKKDNVVLDRDGKGMFEEESSSGTLVLYAIPVCTMLYIGLFLMLGILYFTDIDLHRTIYEIYHWQPIPEISWDPGFGA